MAGVASPIFERSRAAGVRFLAALAVGGVVASLVLSLPIYLIGTAASRLLPHTLRAFVVVAIALALGIADILNKTPHVWRQVPQRFARTLQGATLGLTWGFDLGLLITTQKTTSLLWASIAGVMLLDPSAIAPTLAGLSVVATAGIVVWSVTPMGARIIGPPTRARMPRIRRAAGSLIVIASLVWLSLAVA